MINHYSWRSYLLLPNAILETVSVLWNKFSWVHIWSQFIYDIVCHILFKYCLKKNIFIFISRCFEKRLKIQVPVFCQKKSNRMFVFKCHLPDIFLNNKPNNFFWTRKKVAASIIVAITSVDKHNNITYYHCRYCQSPPCVVKINWYQHKMKINKVCTNQFNRCFVIISVWI